MRGLSRKHQEARRDLLARYADREPCEPCDTYAEELARVENENRSDPVLNRLGR
jgi:hypothetical protein